MIRWSGFLFLAATVNLQQHLHGNREPCNGGVVSAADSEDDDGGRRTSNTTTTHVMSTPQGVSILESVTEIEETLVELASRQEKRNDASILLLLVHSHECLEPCEAAVQALDEAAARHRQQQQQQEAESNAYVPPFAQMELNHLISAAASSSTAQTLSPWNPLAENVLRVPSLLVLVQDSSAPDVMELWEWDLLTVVDDARLVQNATQILALYRHYHSRLVHLADGVEWRPLQEPAEASSLALLHPRRALSWTVKRLWVDMFEQALQWVIRGEWDKLFTSHVANDGTVVDVLPPSPLPPALSLEEESRRAAVWDPLERDVAPNDFVVFCQCQQYAYHDDHPQSQKGLYDTFAQLAQSMVHRHNVLYTAVVDCKDEGRHDGAVMAWRFSSAPGRTDKSDLVGQYLWMPPARHGSRSLLQFHARHATPSLLWFDGQWTASLALSYVVDVQALWFVNLHHHDTADPHAQGAVRQFARECQDWQRRPRAQAEDDDDDDTGDVMSCVLVPSTETRMLTTFGIDLWNHVDEQFLQMLEQMDKDDAEASSPVVPDLLPQLVLVDRRERKKGPRRGMSLYRLAQPFDPPDVTQFLHDFWNGQLTPEVKSSHDDDDHDDEELLENEYGVKILTGRHWAQLVSSERTTTATTTGSVVLVFSPSCGHCKRVLPMYNQLAQLLLHHIPSKAGGGWASVLTFYLLDVSTDDLTPDVAVPWVPDLLYVAPNGTTTVADQYNSNDPRNRRLVGDSINHYWHIMEWLLQVMELPQATAASGHSEDDGDDDKAVPPPPPTWTDLLADLQQHLQALAKKRDEARQKQDGDGEDIG